MLGITTYNGDIVVANTAVVIADVKEQVAENVIVANPAEYKETPKLGMSITKLLNGIPDEFYFNRLKIQLKTQHLTGKVVSISDTEINIEL
jgi:hypothetical protein